MSDLSSQFNRINNSESPKRSLRIVLIVDMAHNIISGGVGFDINCGVRLLRTNLFEKDVQPVKEQLTQTLFNHIPVGKYLDLGIAFL